MGEQAARRFKEVESKLPFDTNNITDAGCNKVVTTLYDKNPPYGHDPDTLSILFGNNHLSKPGRLFHGCGKETFQEMSRCWKCYCLAHYVDDYRNLNAFSVPLTRVDCLW